MNAKTRIVSYLLVLAVPAVISSTAVASEPGVVDQLTSIEWKETLDAIVDVLVEILETATEGIQEGADMLTSDETEEVES